MSDLLFQLAGCRRDGGESNGAPPSRRSPFDAWGRRLLTGHIEEERRGAAPGGLLPLALFGLLARLLAILAAHREWQRAQPLLGDLFAAFETVSVVAVLEPGERVVHLVQRLGLHLNERELDVLLNIGL